MVLLGLAVKVGLVLAGDVRGNGHALGQLEVTALERRDLRGARRQRARRTVEP